MAAHAGEIAEQTGDFRCAKCKNVVHVEQGGRIPKCPACDSDTFSERIGEPHDRLS